MKKILLHICCGPCAITCVEVLQDAGFAVTGFFYNPNIHPAKEYLRRKEGALEVAARMNFPIISASEPDGPGHLDNMGPDNKGKFCEYSPQDFFRAVSFKEHNRCLFCYKLRLQKTLDLAQSGGYDYISSSLLYSKYQKHDAIRVIGESIATASASQIGSSVGFYYSDFRLGWGRGIKLSKKWEVFRQQYCGCIYSEMQRYAEELNAC